MWLGAGLITAGVSAAMLAGAAVAGADTDSGPSSGSATSSGSAKPDTGQAPNSSDTKPNSSRSRSRTDGRSPTRSKRIPTTGVSAAADDRGATRCRRRRPVRPTTRPPNPLTSTLTSRRAGMPPRRQKPSTSRRNRRPTTRPFPVRYGRGRVEPPGSQTIRTHCSGDGAGGGRSDRTSARCGSHGSNAHRRCHDRAPVELGSRGSSRQAGAAAPQPSIVGLISSAVFNVLSTAERLVNGPPTVPPNSTVTVRSSTLDDRQRTCRARRLVLPRG